MTVSCQGTPDCVFHPVRASKAVHSRRGYLCSGALNGFTLNELVGDGVRVVMERKVAPSYYHFMNFLHASNLSKENSYLYKRQYLRALIALCVSAGSIAR